MPEQPTTATTTTAAPTKTQSVILRAYPKVIFFWPTWIFSLLAGLIEVSTSASPLHLGTVWMCIFAFNLLVISFDFTEVVSVMALALVAVLIFAGLYFGFLGFIGGFFTKLQLHMDSNFYFTIFGLFTIIYVCVLIKTRFDYWEFRNNEVIHRQGVFPDIKRYSSEDLRWFKEIPDVLERLMAGAGRMILTTPREPQPIVIEHVLMIGSIDERIADILGTQRVTIA